MTPLINQRTVSALEDHFNGTTLATIAREFDAENIPCDQAFSPAPAGQRRTLFRQYMHSVDLSKPRDARKVLNVFASVLSELEAAPENPRLYDHDLAKRTVSDLCRLLKRTVSDLCRLLKRDGYEYQNGRVVAVGRATSLDELQDAISPLDLPYLQQQIERMREAADADPWLAIGTAKELIETTCKTILRVRAVTVSAKPEVPELLKATRESLQLMPDQVPGSAKGADTIKRLLSNLGTIAQNLAELRQNYGTGHGQDGRAKGLDPRHARLAVNSAVTLVTFLIETHQAKPVPQPATAVAPPPEKPTG